MSKSHVQGNPNREAKWNDIQSSQSDIQSSQSAMIFRLIRMQTVTAISLNNSVLSQHLVMVKTRSIL